MGPIEILRRYMTTGNGGGVWRSKINTPIVEVDYQSARLLHEEIEALQQPIPTPIAKSWSSLSTLEKLRDMLNDDEATPTMRKVARDVLNEVEARYRRRVEPLDNQTGTSLELFCLLTNWLDRKYPKRGVDAGEVNAMISLLMELEALFARLPIVEQRNDQPEATA